MIKPNFRMDCMETEIPSDVRHRMCSIMIAISSQMIHFLCVVSSLWFPLLHLPQTAIREIDVYYPQLQLRCPREHKHILVDL